MTRLPRPAALAILALVVGTSAACSVTNPQTTQLAYTPGDGAYVPLSADVSVTSLLIVTEDAESPGTLIGRVVNDGTEPAAVQISGGEQGQAVVSLQVSPRSSVALGPDGDREVVVDSVGVVPGGLVPMTVTLEGGESQNVGVPVLDGTFEEYADLVPTPSPTFTPTASPTDA